MALSHCIAICSFSVWLIPITAGFDGVGVVGRELELGSLKKHKLLVFLGFDSTQFSSLGRILVREFGDAGSGEATGCSNIGGGVDGAVGTGLFE